MAFGKRLMLALIVPLSVLDAGSERAGIIFGMVGRC